MSLFIETPQQEQLRLLREQREQLKHLRSMSEGAGVVGSAEDTSQMDRSLLDQRLFASAPAPNSTKPAGSPSAKGSLRDSIRGLGRKRCKGVSGVSIGRRGGRGVSGEPYSIAQESYAEQLKFDRQRTRRRRGAAVARSLLVVVLVPILLFAAFVGSYALTCILNGASPQELTLLMGELFAKMQAYGGLVIAMFSS